MDNPAMNTYMNPAGRLENVMQQLLSHNRNVATRSALQAVLNVHDDAALVHGMGKILQLPDQACDLIKQVESDDWYLSWHGPIKQALAATLNVDQALSNVLQHYSKAEVVSLGAASRLLDRIPIDESLLEEVTRQAQDLHDEILNNTEFPETFKRFLLKQVDRIIRAIREYRITGPEGIDEALDAVLGSLYRNSGLIEKSFSESSTTERWMKRLWELANKAAILTTLSSGALLLPEGAMKVFDIIQIGG